MMFFVILNVLVVISGQKEVIHYVNHQLEGILSTVHRTDDGDPFNFKIYPLKNTIITMKLIYGILQTSLPTLLS